MKKVIIISGFWIMGLSGFLQTTIPAGQKENGKKVYGKNCLACHMGDGKGVPGLYPPLAKTDWVTGDKVRLIKLIINGLNDPITVNGEEYYSPMAPFNYLSDQEIADVLTYIRSNFGNSASAITPAEVKAVRAKK